MVQFAWGGSVDGVLQRLAHAGLLATVPLYPVLIILFSSQSSATLFAELRGQGKYSFRIN